LLKKKKELESQKIATVKQTRKSS